MYRNCITLRCYGQNCYVGRLDVHLSSGPLTVRLSPNLSLKLRFVLVLFVQQTMTFHPTVDDYILMLPWGYWVFWNDSPTQAALPCLVPGHHSNRRSLYRLPSPWLPLPLATVVEVKKLVSAPSLTLKELCVFVVCLFTKCVSLLLAVINILRWVVSVCELTSLVETLDGMQGKPPCCSFIGWMADWECDGRSTINFPVVGKGHGVTALWSTIKRTRQIGRGGAGRRESIDRRVRQRRGRRCSFT